MTGPADAPLAEGADSTSPVCHTCGTTAAADGPSTALTWSMAVEGGRATWTCPECARRHVRGIEAKLDSAWW